MMNPQAGLPAIPDDLRALMARVGPHWRDNVGGNVDLMIKRFSVRHPR